MINKNTIIELKYDNELVSLASKLFNDGEVSDLAKLPSNLYICKVKDGKSYEVEIQSPFLKKQKVCCECTFYKQHHICKHIIAGLMLIKEEKNKKQEVSENKIDEKNKHKLSTLNISQILEEIPHKELVSFVKAYAKRDIKFSTQLKVSFARKIDVTNNAEKYKTILNSIIRPHTGQAKVNASDIKSAIRVLEDFIGQINDCISLGQYREALDIYMAAFAKLEYVRYHFHYQADVLTQLSTKYHKTITFFLGEKLPPELRYSLIEFLNDLSKRSYYHYTDIVYNIVYLQLPFLKSDDNIDMQKRLETMIQVRSGKETSIILALWLLCEHKYTDASWLFIKTFQLHLVEMADLLLEAGEDKLALKMLESMHNPKKVNKDVVNRLVFLYVRFNKLSKLKESAIIAYINSGDLKYIDILKRALSEEEYGKMMLFLENELKVKENDPNFLTKIYRKEENWSGLLLYMDRMGQLDLLKENDVVLYKNEKKGLIQLYLHLLRQYLDFTIGDQAYEYLSALKHHWSHERMDHLINEVGKFLKAEYAERSKIAGLFE